MSAPSASITSPGVRVAFVGFGEVAAAFAPAFAAAGAKVSAYDVRAWLIG